MRGLRILFMAMLGAVAACADAPHRLTPTAPTPPAAGPPTFTWSESSYPTEDEFAANGGGGSSLTVDGPYAYFASSVFAASGITRATWVNSMSSSLVTELVEGDGRVINSRADPHASSMYRPVANGYKNHDSQISTLSRTCGLTGKARIEASASLFLLYRGTSGSVYAAWSDGFTKHANDVSQPACQRQEEEQVETCGSQFYCDPGSGSGAYPPPPSGDGGSGGTGGSCTLYRITDEESYDGGSTWRVVAEYYVWRCS